MANISESSVVIAIRDWQWTQALRRQQPGDPSAMPARYVGLSKHAEYKLGDYINEQDDRLLLIEVKATRDKINDEWNAPVKSAFSALSRWLTTVSDNNLRLLKESAQCHHFVFYEDTPENTTPPDANLLLMPYLTGMVTRSTFIKRRLKRANRQLGLGLGTIVDSDPLDPPGSIRYRSRAAVWLDSIPDFQTRLIDSTTGNHYWDYLGLPLDVFQDYVNEVCATPSPLSAIVMSTSGSFFAYFTHTNDLKAILGPKPAPNLQLLIPRAPSGVTGSADAASGVDSPPALALATPPPTPSPSPRSSSTP